MLRCSPALFSGTASLFRSKVGTTLSMYFNGRKLTDRSLAWMEMRTTLAKLHYVFDLELLDKDLDWQDQSRMHTLWRKPPLKVRVRDRET